MVCTWLSASGSSTKQYLIQQKVFWPLWRSCEAAERVYICSVLCIVFSLGLGAIKLDLRL